jgi:diguanylate cyclase (GGDEF)-like protein
MARILIVDDRAVNRQFLVTLLGYANHQLIEAGDGAEALEVVRNSRPDLVITDILMPTMDGYEFVRRLRDDPETASVAVIFYTAHYHKEEASQLAASCGVAHILTKPCEPELILQTVEQLLQMPEEARPAPVLADFASEHVRVITDKLSRTADDLGVANQKLSALIDICLKLASEREPRKLLDEVCGTARELFGARYAMLAVGSRNNASDIYFRTSGVDAHTAANIDRPVLTDGIVGAAYHSRSPRRMKQIVNGGDSDGLPAGFPTAASLVVAPVVSLNHVYGWICLTNKVGAEQFNDEDERLLAILAAQVGRIYENGSLYEDLEIQARDLAAEIERRRQTQQKVERLNRVHAVLSGINTLIVRERDRQQLFDKACRIAVELGGFGIAWIDILDSQSQEFAAAAFGGIDGRPSDSRQLFSPPTRHTDGLIERAIAERKPAWDNNLSQQTSGRSERLARAISLGFKSRIVLPLVVDRKVVGCLALLTREPGFFTADEVKLLRELADDISFAMAHIEQQEKLMYLAFFDSLTGLPNRELFLDRIDQHMRASEGEAGMAAVILLDLERFRMVNESLGSGAGDQLLRLVASRLELTCGGKDGLGRVGTNSFGQLMRGVRGASDVVHAIESRSLSCFWDAYHINDTELRVAAKTGIAIFPGDGRDAHELLRNAEAALKKAKSSGSRYEFYSAELNARAAEVLTLETRMRKAVDNREFVLHYQPKYTLASGEICGVEALIRWQDPDTGLVPPGRFISLLEETGLIVEVGRWVLSRAMQDYRDWVTSGCIAPRIAVNVSAIELQQRDFLNATIEIVQRYGDIPEAVELEITESLMMQDLKQTIRSLNVLRGLGLTVAMDDFGTGYSSLSHIARLPIDKVKIDRSFICGMTGNQQDLLVASSTVVLAHSLGLRVIAEGVETQEQLDALRKLECDEVQGYFFSKPVPKEQIDTLLKKKG